MNQLHDTIKEEAKKAKERLAMLEQIQYLWLPQAFSITLDKFTLGCCQDYNHQSQWDADKDRIFRSHLGAAVAEYKAYLIGRLELKEGECQPDTQQ